MWSKGLLLANLVSMAYAGVKFLYPYQGITVYVNDGQSQSNGQMMTNPQLSKI